MNIEIKRHSFSHILAMAVKELFPDVKLGIGPAIDNGFYYDFDFAENISDKDLRQIEKKMKHLLKQQVSFEQYSLSIDEAIAKFKEEGADYKVQLVEELAQDGETEVSIFKNINQKGELVFEDLCKGPHVANIKDLPADGFKIEKLAGAYWQGDEKNKMLTRIYGLAFDSKVELDEHLKFLAEAKKRDHRVLGTKLGLYTIDPEVGIGLPLWKPKGALLINNLRRWFEDEQLKRGYVPVLTPHIGRKKLWETSGHWGFYNDGMYPPIELGQTLEDYQDNRKAKETEIYLLKPMNCPFHVKIFTSDVHSYRDLPVKYYEFGTVYRYEQKGELGGLTRVRGFTQDDAHIICPANKLEEEFAKVVDFSFFVLGTFGFKIKAYLSMRDPNNKEKYLGDDENWEMAQETIKKILTNKGIEFVAEEGEAAFYGPKMDLKVEDSIGRQRQLSTVQFDFNLPEKFDINFINEKGEKEKPYIIHRALLGSVERFMGILIEHFAGTFPLWLAPTQATIVPVTPDFNDYAKSVQEKLALAGLRVDVDLADHHLNKKVKNAEQNRVNYILVVGEKEQKEDSVAVRDYKTKAQVEMKVEEFVGKAQKEVVDKVN